MNNKQKTLLELLAHYLFNHKIDVGLTEEIEEEAKVQGVQGLVNSHAYNVIGRSIQSFYAHAQLDRLLEGIPHVILKGCASAYYYPNPYLRSMGDVDFLVYPEDVEKVKKIFMCNGFVLDHETSLHKCYLRQGIIYEMHISINGIPAAYRHKEQLLHDVIQKAQVKQTQFGKMVVPDDYHAGLVCLFHIVEHLTTTGIGIRHLCDWACFINYFGAQGEMYKEELEEVGLWRFMQVISLACVKYLYIEYQPWMETAKEHLLEQIIDEFFLCGNFGRDRRPEDEWLVVYKGSNGEIRQLLSSLATATRLHWPIAERNKALIPFGCLFFGLRYLVNIIKGKHELINVHELAQRTKKRNKMYRQLGLFIKNNSME